MKTTKAVLAAVAATLVTACGGGGGSDTGSSVTPAATPDPVIAPATVSVIVTDNFSKEFKRALATITSIELIAGDTTEVIFTGESTIDLLLLQNFLEIFTVDEDVTPGEYERIRVQLSALQLVRENADGTVAEIIDAVISGNGRLDLVPASAFPIGSGESLFVTLDFDMDKTLRTVTDNNGVIEVQPVVFAAVSDIPPQARLARVNGNVDSLNADGFRLCRARTESFAGNTAPQLPVSCLPVLVNSNTGLFGPSGTPIALADLKTGESVAVIGNLLSGPQTLLSRVGDNDDRWWDDFDWDWKKIFKSIDNRFRQFDDDKKKKGKDKDKGKSEDDDEEDQGEDDKDKDDETPVAPETPVEPETPVAPEAPSQPEDPFTLAAWIVEDGNGGPYGQYAGIVRSVVEPDGQFALQPAADSGLTEPVTGQLFDQTAIFSLTGEPLTAAEMREGVDVVIDGIPIINGPTLDAGTLLRSALILVDLNSNNPAPIVGTGDLIRGKLLSADVAGNVIIASTPDGDRCVLTPDADLYIVTSTAQGSESRIVLLSALSAGMTLDIFGNEDPGGCFNANTILATPPPLP